MVSGSSFDHKVLRIDSLSFDRVRSVQWPLASRMASAFIWLIQNLFPRSLFPNHMSKFFTACLMYTYCLDMEKDLNPSCNSSFRPFTCVCGAFMWADQPPMGRFTSLRVTRFPRKPPMPHCHPPLSSLPSELIRLAKSRSLIPFNNSKYVANSGPKV